MINSLAFHILKKMELESLEDQFASTGYWSPNVLDVRLMLIDGMPRGAEIRT
jgi:hypothetical protein